MEETEKKEQPVDRIFKPNTEFTINLRQLAIFEEALLPFDWMIALLKDAKNRAAAKEGNMVNTYKEDYILNEKGDFQLFNGKPRLKDGFWEKHKDSL